MGCIFNVRSFLIVVAQNLQVQKAVLHHRKFARLAVPYGFSAYEVGVFLEK